jgi:hypothetical protein
MPLRKKHVRRIVLALLAAGVLGPLAFLACYAAYMRGGAYGRAIEAGLASRLRCDATVRGARPTGVATAAADSADLVWTAGEGRLALHLEGIRAERNSFGWYVTAADGSLSLTGPAPWDTLAALNQRLVQADGAAQLVAITANRLRVDLDLDTLKVETTARAVGLSNLGTFTLSLLPPDQGAARARPAMDEADSFRPVAILRLNPTSDRGVFDGLRVEAKDVPLSTVRRMLKTGSAPARGTADVSIAWHWPEAKANAARATSIRAGAHKMDLAEWTRGIPGGPITGTAELAVTHAKERQGAPATEVVLTSGAGTLSDETLKWLTGPPAGLTAAGPISAKTITFDRLALRCRIVGDRGQFEGPRDADGTIPVLTCRLFGVDVPIVKAGPRTFDAAALWAALKPALAPAPEIK